MTSTVPVAGEQEIDEVIASSLVPVIVEFWAEWCPPCQVVAPLLDAIASDYGDRLSVFTVNTDEHPGLAARFDVMSVPTLLAFSQGELQQRLVGARSRSRLLEELGDVLT